MKSIVQETAKSPIIQSGITRNQQWVCSRAHQSAFLVRDASGSMSGQKATDVEEATRTLIADLSHPVNKDGFRVGIVDFSNGASVTSRLEKATILKQRPLNLSVGGNTNISAGLESALSMIQEAETMCEEGIQQLRPCVFLLSDGCHNAGPFSHPVAEQLKEKADLVTVAFGSDADELFLQELATSPQHFYRTSNGEELRSFLKVIGKTLTVTLATKTNATQALGKIQRHIDQCWR